MDDNGDLGDVPCGELCRDRADGVADPGADLWVPVLMHGQVVGARGEEC